LKNPSDFWKKNRAMKKIFLLVIAICLLGQVYAQSRVVSTDKGGWAYIIYDDKTKQQDVFNPDINYKNYHLDENDVEYYGFSANFLQVPGHNYFWYKIDNAPLNKIDTTTFVIELRTEGRYKDYWFLSFKAKEDEEVFEYFTINQNGKEESESNNSLIMLSKDKKILEKAKKDIKRMVRFNALVSEFPLFGESVDFFEASAYQETIKGIEKARKILVKEDLFEMLYCRLDLYQCRVMSSLIFDIDRKKDKTEEDIKKYFEAVQAYKKHTKYVKERYEAAIKRKDELSTKYFRDVRGYLAMLYDNYVDKYKDSPNDYATFAAQHNTNKQREDDLKIANSTNAEGFSMLQEAIIQKDFTRVRRFVEAGADLRYKNPKNLQNVLDVAIINADAETFSLILKKIKSQYSAYETSYDYFSSDLGSAAYKNIRTAKIENLKVAMNHTERARISLINYYYQPDIRFNDKRLQELLNIPGYFRAESFFEKSYEKKRTPLMYACEKNDIEMVRFLISKIHPDYYNQIDNEGMTALMIAAKENNKEIVEYLLGTGFNAKTINNKTDKTAMDYATDKSLKKILKAKMK